MVFDIYTFVEGLWILLPAYAANGLAPLIGRKKNLHSIDFGKKMFGKPLLGIGKSWEGLALGGFVAITIAGVEMLAFPYLPWNLSPIELNIVPMSLLLGGLIGFGAMFGDIVASFIKRRIGLDRGKPAPILDQNDFVVGAFVFAAIMVSIEISWVILWLIITPIFHFISCIIGFRLGIKKTPW